MSRTTPPPPGNGDGVARVALATLMGELRQPALAAEARLAAAAVAPGGAGAGDASLERVLATMSRLAADAEANAPGSSAAGALEAVGDDVVASLVAEFEALGAKADFGTAVDNVMRQLLHADVMLAPMRRICELFPAWLAENAPRLTAAQYQQ
jgi:hypothetical protein